LPSHPGAAESDKKEKIMSKSHIETLKQLETSSNYQAVLPLIGSVLYLADKVEQLQEEKQDKPSICDSEINDQKISRPVLQRMAMDIISAAGEDEGLRTRIYKALRSFQ
jgi:hypothetical protein